MREFVCLVAFPVTCLSPSAMIGRGCYSDRSSSLLYINLSHISQSHITYTATLNYYYYLNIKKILFLFKHNDIFMKRNNCVKCVSLGCSCRARMHSQSNIK